MLGAGAASAAIAPAIPRNRVWSFPKNIVVPQLVGSTLNIRMPMRFAIGDVITVNTYGPLIVTRVAESEGMIDLRGPSDRRGVLHYPSFPPGSIRTLARKFWNQARIDEMDWIESQAPPRFAARIES